MLAVTILSTGIAAWGSWITSDLASLFGFEMRSMLLQKSQQLSLQQFDSVGISSMITRTTSDIINLQRTMGMMLQMVVPAPILVVVSIVMTIMVSPVMAVIQLAFMTVLLALTAVILKKSNALSRSIQARLDRINQVVRETVTGVRVIRAFGNESYEEERSGIAYEDYADNMIRLNRLFAVITPVVWLLMGALWRSFWGWAGPFPGRLAGGGADTAVAEYSTLTMAYLIMAASVLTTLPKARACLERLRELLNTEPAVSDPIRSPMTALPAPSDTVEFDHVTFAYEGAEEPVIRDLSFTLRPGQTTAVIGSTGSGKSTLGRPAAAPPRHPVGPHPARGRGRARTLPAGAADRIAWRAAEGVPVRRHYRGKPAHGPGGHTGGELWEALRIAQAKDFVKRLPKGLEAPVAQGGTNFSAGSASAWAIARALVKRADILIFDDSFSALDVRTDAALRKALLQSVMAARQGSSSPTGEHHPGRRPNSGTG